MFFSNNRIGSMAANVTVEAAAGYDNEHAIYDVMIESCENQEKLFTAAIFCDMQEAAMLHEGAAVEDIEAFQEASIKGFIQKIKEFVKKVWAKIKAVFKSIIAKLDSWFMTNSKKFASKYEKELKGKDLTKFKVNMEKPKGFPELKTPGMVGWNYDDRETNLFEEASEKFIGHKLSKDSFKSDFHKLCFEDSEEVTGKAVVDGAIGRLKDKDIVKEMKKKESDMDKALKGISSSIDKVEKDHNYASVAYDKESKKYTARGGNDSDDKKTKNYSNLRNVVSAYCNVATTITSALVNEAKFQVAQDRRIVAKAVAWNPKKHMNESYEEADEIATFISEAAEWELLTDLR